MKDTERYAEAKFFHINTEQISMPEGTWDITGMYQDDFCRNLPKCYVYINIFFDTFTCYLPLHDNLSKRKMSIFLNDDYYDWYELHKYEAFSLSTNSQVWGILNVAGKLFGGKKNSDASQTRYAGRVSV